MPSSSQVHRLALEGRRGVWAARLPGTVSRCSHSLSICPHCFGNYWARDNDRHFLSSGVRGRSRNRLLERKVGDAAPSERDGTALGGGPSWRTQSDFEVT